LKIKPPILELIEKLTRFKEKGYINVTLNIKEEYEEYEGELTLKKKECNVY
jgi:hypothetical protein